MNTSARTKLIVFLTVKFSFAQSVRRLLAARVNKTALMGGRNVRTRRKVEGTPSRFSPTQPAWRQSPCQRVDNPARPGNQAFYLFGCKIDCGDLA
jgi:hypothetical protein